MNNFQYYTPTKVFFGKGVENNVGEVLKEYGASKVLVHFGGGSAKRSGLMGRIEASLDAAKIEYIELGGVSPNPKIELVREGVELCKKEGVDFILAVGGGSAIDSSKAIALSLGTGADDWDIITGKVKATKCMPLAAVLTISAAGSEMSNSHVITNLSIPMKRGLNTDLIRPVVSFLDPELTYTVSKYQTACGVVDIMMHTMERYFTGDVDTILTDRIAESILLSVKEAGSVAIENPNDYEARATIMWSSSLSHNGLTACGKNFKTLAAHQLEHGISAVFDNVAHGAGLAVVYPAFSKYLYKYDLPRYCRMANKVWGIPENPDDPEGVALAGIKAMKDYFRSLGMPVSMSELGIGPDRFAEIAENVTFGSKRTIPTYKALDNDDIIRIFELTEID